MLNNNEWITYEHTIIKIRDMENGHIVNCISMLERQIVSLQLLQTEDKNDMIYTNRMIKRKQHWIKKFTEELIRREDINEFTL